MDLETLRSLSDTDWAGDVSVQRRMRRTREDALPARRVDTRRDWRRSIMATGWSLPLVPLCGDTCLPFPRGNILCGLVGPSFGGQLCPGRCELARRPTDDGPCGLDDGPPRQDTSGRLTTAKIFRRIYIQGKSRFSANVQSAKTPICTPSSHHHHNSVEGYDRKICTLVIPILTYARNEEGGCGRR
jgi:hypothetical protein